jgi:hypothetical protein
VAPRRSSYAPFQTERFDDEDSAGIFKQAVDEAGQQWPPGWVKGKGYVAPTAGDEDALRYRFDNGAPECLKNRTDVSEQYRADCVRELETYLLPTFGNRDVRSTEHFSRATVGAWVNRMAVTKVWRGSKHRPMSPKTLKNLHGCLGPLFSGLSGAAADGARLPEAGSDPPAAAREKPAAVPAARTELAAT